MIKAVLYYILDGRCCPRVVAACSDLSARPYRTVYVCTQCVPRCDFLLVHLVAPGGI